MLNVYFSQQNKGHVLKVLWLKPRKKKRLIRHCKENLVRSLTRKNFAITFHSSRMEITNVGKVSFCLIRVTSLTLGARFSFLGISVTVD